MRHAGRKPLDVDEPHAYLRLYAHASLHGRSAEQNALAATKCYRVPKRRLLKCHFTPVLGPATLIISAFISFSMTTRDELDRPRTRESFEFIYYFYGHINAEEDAAMMPLLLIYFIRDDMIITILCARW